MRKKAAQFFCFVIWAYIALGIYFLVRFLFVPPVPPIFFCLLPLFLAAAVFTVKEMLPDDVLDGNAGWISIGVLFWSCFLGLPPGHFSFLSIPPDVLRLFVGFGTFVILTVMFLFFSKSGKLPYLQTYMLTTKYTVLVVWSAWLGFSMRYITKGNELLFFTDFFAKLFISGLCVVGGMVLIVALIVLREIVRFLIRLHHYAFSKSAKA